MTDLEGAVVLVVGGTGGLGSRMSDRLSTAGATVVSASRGSSWDIRDEAMPQRLVAAIESEHGRLDGVVIAAGVVAFGPSSELSNETLTELFAVNTTGPIRLIREATPLLTASAGTDRKPFIVTLSGIVSEVPTAGMAAYSAAKAALAAFTVATSRELRRSGIRILDARPGHVETELSRHPIAGEAPKLGEGIDPDKVAERIVRAIIDDEKDLPSAAFGD
ncbi:SDR family NAD(P)-dependent oxidoreductase [Amnibacterium flavum]|uniref:Short-chain dehydrogenase n=1 Tax=Amnibacterium flavum TaxID=2173173 RepID=A0A2V1HQH1_9MICO|nr:SDR family oxidoreductase [Amnibacterium flavum]PVZ93369.1 short-chain dehydrogenase [Amnibacterium flavum]